MAEYIRTRLDVPEDQKPSADCILAQGDDFFKGIFELLLRSDETLKKFYEAHQDDPDICHRFAAALKDEFGDIPHKQTLTVSIPKIQIPQIQIPQIPPIPLDVFEANRIAMERWNKISESIATAYTNMHNVISVFSQYSDCLLYTSPSPRD